VAPPSDPSTAIDHLIPKPCVVSPERTIDYPAWWELPEQLRQRIEAWQQDSGWIYAYHLGAAPGTKVRLAGLGSGPGMADLPAWPRHGPPAHGGQLGVRRRVAPDLAAAGPGGQYDGSDADLMLGDAGNLYLFTCVTCDDRPVAAVLQSS
jgi:hypothetical protein